MLRAKFKFIRYGRLGRSNTIPTEGRKLNELQISRYAALLHRGEIEDRILAEHVGNLLLAYEAAHDRLNELIPNPHKIEGEDWMDDEADEALQRHRFWWTWGN
ncbi:MAG: hypothetical protein E6R03_12685 [Hyphomicrobiaceae bacterium]|nr:MAG: hypothetical protein E6R03_12685 [Hyphomicrobiaceae bacterium]